MPDITTRLATLDDLDGLAPLFDGYRQFYEQVPDLGLARRYIDERNESVIYVAANERGTGAGRKLMQAAEARAAGTGAARMELSTARTNKIGQSLCESQGWVKDEAFLVYGKSFAK